MPEAIASTFFASADFNAAHVGRLIGPEGARRQSLCQAGRQRFVFAASVTAVAVAGTSDAKLGPRGSPA